MELRVSEICKATGGHLISGSKDAVVRSMTVDSRTVGENALFVPLRGTKTDGHMFIQAALAAGAVGSLLKRGGVPIQTLPSGAVLIEVDDPLQALGAIARCWRERCQTILVAITGSNGKTSTKEMAWSIVSRCRPCFRTPGNFNNLIGLPLSLCSLQPDHATAILEMGMSEPGEIRRLCDISMPRIGLITNIGPSHLEQLKTLDAVAAAKAELFESLPPEGTAIVNNDDPMSPRLIARTKARVVRFGINGGDVTIAGPYAANGSGTRFELQMFGRRVPVQLQVPGRHFVSNALAAAAIAGALGIDINDIAAGLAAFRGVPGRMELLRIKEVLVINDAYNANPLSMQHALQVLSAYAGAYRRIAVLGDMLELGERSHEFHYEIGKYAAACALDFLYVTGAFAAAIRDGALAGGMSDDRVVSREDAETLGRELCTILRPGDVILVKGSRGARMERVIDVLRSTTADAAHASSG
ncbi:MAG: UDP-N-acetylmuramoyl-tripeptide--D-alanyl-D-alanine ligase [Desulfobacterota bacterium]|nr:UDP-N-acetylmuramoyl-tripeptide--D-alanyl-D-alanine ligase [Thermodesulfobacteriota bacterium]